MRDAFSEVTPRPKKKKKACTPGNGEVELPSAVDDTPQLPEVQNPTSSLSRSVSGVSGQSAGLRVSGPSVHTMSPPVSGVNVQVVSPSVSGLSVQSVSPSVSGLNVQCVSPSVSGLSVQSMSPSVSGLNVQSVSPSVSGLSVQSMSPSVSGLNVQSTSPSVSVLNVQSVSPSICRQSPTATPVATPMSSRQPSIRAQSCKGCQHKAKLNNLQRVNNRLKGKVINLKTTITELKSVSAILYYKMKNVSVSTIGETLGLYDPSVTP